MKKLIARACASLLLLFSLTGAGFYLYARSHFSELPGRLKSELSRRGVKLQFQRAEINSAKLNLSLKNLLVEGEALPLRFQVEEATFSIVPFPAFPFFKGRLELKRPEVVKRVRANYLFAAPAPSPFNGETYFANFWKMVSGSLRIEVQIRDGKAESFGIAEADAKLELHRWLWDQMGLQRVEIEHEIDRINLISTPWLTGLHWKGLTHFENLTFTSLNQEFWIGPVSAQGTGRYEIKSQKWNFGFFVPKLDLAKSGLKADSSTDWLSSAAGELEANITGQGIGSDFESMNFEGKIIGSNLRLRVKTPLVNGEITTNIDAEITTEETVEVKALVDGSLTESKVGWKNYFVKEKGIPLSFSLGLEGKKQLFHLTKGLLVFHNLRVPVTGEFTLFGNSEPPASGRLHLQIPRTQLLGWEKFFPEYLAYKADGSVEADLDYNGPLPPQDPRAMQVTATLRADQVQFPMIKEWLPRRLNETTDFAGVFAMQTNTSLSYSNGKWGKLNSESNLDFSSTAIQAIDRFVKPPGVPFRLSLKLDGKVNQVDINQGEFALGGIRGLVHGTFENPADPVFNLHLGLAETKAAELQKYFPALDSTSLASLNGSVQGSAEVKGLQFTAGGIGPLRFEGTAALNHLSFTYQPPFPAKKVELISLTGPIDFSNLGAKSNNLIFQFPQTDAKLSFSLASFHSPKIDVQITGHRFSLADFFTGPQAKFEQATSPSEASAPSAAKPQKFAFPDLGRSEVIAAIHFQRLDWNGENASDFFSQFNYRDRLFTLNKLEAKVLGGQISATSRWDERGRLPEAAMEMKLEKVDTNRFCASFFPSFQDLFSGKLTSEFLLKSRGQTLSALKENAEGQGKFHLEDGVFYSLALATKPLENLETLLGGEKSLSLPKFSNKVNTAEGTFTIHSQKLEVSNLLIRTNLVDVSGEKFEIDKDQNIQAKLEWFPKTPLFANTPLASFQAANGHSGLPLNVGGTLKNPSFLMDKNEVFSRLRNSALSKLQVGRERLKFRGQASTKSDSKKRFEKMKAMFR